MIIITVHYGVSKTELLHTDKPEIIETVAYGSANQGAFPTLFGAKEAVGKFACIGPDGKGEVNGYPAPAFIAPYAKEEKSGPSFGYMQKWKPGSHSGFNRL